VELLELGGFEGVDLDSFLGAEATGLHALLREQDKPARALPPLRPVVL
jgi:hypothetical protein